MAKKYIDTDNKAYYFSAEALNNEIKAKAGKREIKNGKPVKVTTQDQIMRNIADVAGVTREAVNNWKLGRNGPRDMIAIKDCASVLNIDYLKLLIPLNDQEDKMSLEEEKVIKEVFKKCIDLLYLYGKSNNKSIFKEVTNIHKYVDGSLLSISSISKYKLHRILLEFIDMIDDGFEPNARWIAINQYLNGQIASVEDYDMKGSIDYMSPYRCSCYTSRSDTVDNEMAEYIWLEYELGEKLGLTNNKKLPDDFFSYDFDYTYEYLNEYGIKLGYSKEVQDKSPRMIFIDIFSELIKNVFNYEFFMKED